MEEAWIDIPLSATPNLHAPKPANAAAHHGLILQDMINPTPTGAGDLGPAAPARSVMTNQPPPQSGKSTCREQMTVTCYSLLDSTTSFSSLLTSFPMKESVNSEEIHCRTDRRYKRMMKNRESAARSRDRKMAYTFELERKKIDLTEENERLRKEINKQQLLIAVAPEVEAHKKRNRCRSLSALF